MNVCLVHEEYPEETNFGGIATYQKTIAEELIKQSCSVYVICRGLEKDSEYFENGVHVIRLFVKKTCNSVNDYINYRKLVSTTLLKLQNEKKIDIIEVPDWGAETILFEKKRTIPLVVRLHTPLKIWLMYNQNNFGRIKKIMLKWEKQMLNSADLITCCSNILKKIVVKEFNIDEKKIKVSPNPANTVDFFRDNKIKKQNILLFVGSLEERKGICILAQSLNIILKKYPTIKVKFIGKDTKRNKLNISTKKLIYNIVDEKYKDNLDFLGQLSNKNINFYLNIAKVAVFPSLFDNFPYVVLEAMATGVQIVGSKNSGMVEMLNDKTSIYKTGNYKDLVEKIIEKYILSQKNKINESNIVRLKKIYNSKVICEQTIILYSQTIKKYYLNKVTKQELEIVLGKVNKKNDIKSFKREKKGVANLVFKVKTEKKTYIIKKYVYDYNFNLSNKLYNIYEKSNVKIIRPINNKIINYHSFSYNVFEYKKADKIKKINNINYVSKILMCDRKTCEAETLLKKCTKYQKYLTKSKAFNKLLKEDVDYILKMFNLLKKEKMFKENYLNHGDISKKNIITSKKINYIIDFDEVVVTTPLYDFAVIIIKIFTQNNKINFKKYNILKNIYKVKYNNYADLDFIKAIKFYLCKILLEKFYLHQIGKIDLYSKKQLEDNYGKYLKILRQL